MISDKAKVLIAIPAWNEQHSIGRVLQEIKHTYPHLHILVIDDGSSDSTAQLAEQRGIKVVRHSGNLGYTAAIQTAVEKLDDITGALKGPGEPSIDSVTNFAINLVAGADQVLVASAASKQIWVYAVAYTLSVAGTVSFQDEDNLAVTGIMDHAANSGLAIGASGNFAMPLWKLATDKDLEVDIVTAAMDGWITYAIVSV